MKIAVCITTFNRPDVFLKSLDKHLKLLPPSADIFVVDDGSRYPLALSNMHHVTYEYHTINRGIPAAKNRCLGLAYGWGADQIFLFDDDCYPISQNWWKPYVDHKEPHLMYQFKLPSKPSTDMSELYRDDNTVAYSHTRGAMLYVKRVALDTVGCMDTGYGEGMYEHTDWTNRIHNAGLTSHRAMDVPGSDQLLYCLDQNSKVESTLPEQIRRRNMVRNRSLYQKSKTSKEFKEFR